MNQQYMYFIEGIGTLSREAAAKTLVEKMATKGGPGAIILLTAMEHSLVKDMITVPIGPPSPIAKCPHDIPINEPCAKCERFGNGGSGAA